MTPWLLFEYITDAGAGLALVAVLGGILFLAWKLVLGWATGVEGEATPEDKT